MQKNAISFAVPITNNISETTILELFPKRYRPGKCGFSVRINAAMPAVMCAAAFMITGPSTKITNLGALKIVLGMKRFIVYLVFVMLYSFVTGSVRNLIF